MPGIDYKRLSKEIVEALREGKTREERDEEFVTLMAEKVHSKLPACHGLSEENVEAIKMIDMKKAKSILNIINKFNAISAALLWGLISVGTLAIASIWDWVWKK